MVFSGFKDTLRPTAMINIVRVNREVSLEIIHDIFEYWGIKIFEYEPSYERSVNRFSETPRENRCIFIFLKY